MAPFKVLALPDCFVYAKWENCKQKTLVGLKKLKNYFISIISPNMILEGKMEDNSFVTLYQKM